MTLFKRSANLTATSDVGILAANTDGKKAPKPMICLIDTDAAVSKELTECDLNTSSGTLGTPVVVPTNDLIHRPTFCLANYSVPSNLHEYDIIIVDTSSVNEPKTYIEDEHRQSHTTGTISYFKSEYPETLFDPRPFGAVQVNSLIAEVVNKGGLLIVFAGVNYTIEYRFVTLTPNGSSNPAPRAYSIYNFMPTYTSIGNKYGKQVFLQSTQGPLSDLLGRYCNNCRYHAIIHEFSSKRDDSKFIPLLRNSSGEIVGGLIPYGDGAIIVLPDIQDKPTFLRELLMNELPGLFPSLFPYHTESRWLEESSYYLPNQEKLIKEKNDAVEEFERRMAEIEQRIAENIEEYSWLHGLITKGGAELVRDVQKMLKWLEFDDVRYMDDPDKKTQEEDLQVDIPEGLLVIEVKGISGTSKDEDCNQINKIKYRRIEDRRSFDVYALYIVNHQKHLPPLERENPPFKPEQIKDAQNEKRGLLTTWQLFNLYFSVEAGGITKEEARKSLIDFGLINFKPHDCEELGKPVNVLKDKQIVLFDTKTPISISDSLILVRDDRYYKAGILSLESDNQPIQRIEAGPVGIRVNLPVKKSDLYLLKGSS